MKLTLSLTFIILLFNTCHPPFKADYNLVYEKSQTYIRELPGFKSAEEDNLRNFTFHFPDQVIKLKGSDLIMGKINNDTLMDAIVSYDIILNSSRKISHHLLWLNQGNDLVILKDWVDDNKYISISDQEIIAERSKISADSPNHDCNSCKEFVRYKLSADSLIIVK